jgi:hypothetical protein
MRFAAQMAMNPPPATRPTSRLMMTGVAIYLPLLLLLRSSTLTRSTASELMTARRLGAT